MGSIVSCGLFHKGQIEASWNWRFRLGRIRVYHLLGTGRWMVLVRLWTDGEKGQLHAYE